MNENKEQTIALIFSIIGSLAILMQLAISGPSLENILDATKDLVGLLVTVAVFIVAYSINNRTKNFLEIARAALIRVQSRYPDFLIGPRYNRENYDPEKGKGLEYLFVRNNDRNSKVRAKLIPLQPLDEGVLVIYVQKGTLVYALGYASDQVTSDEIRKIQTAVREAVHETVTTKFSGKFDVLSSTDSDVAIILDFAEVEMGKRSFSSAVEACVEIAVRTLLEFKKF